MNIPRPVIAGSTPDFRPIVSADENAHAARPAPVLSRLVADLIPNRELDAAVARALGWRPGLDQSGRVIWFRPGRISPILDLPAFTASRESRAQAVLAVRKAAGLDGAA